MSRPLRIDVEGGWYHITSRGNGGCNIFVDKRDREHFLELLGQLSERYRILIHAYVLMTNHYHLIIQTPEANASSAMQWLNVSYSMWFNRRHGRVGHLLQGRFKAILVEQSGWATVLSYYVHLNPVRIRGLGLSKRQRQAESAGLSRQPSKEEVKQRLRVLREYRWSSYRVYGGYEKGPEWLTKEVLLARAAGRRGKQQRYRQKVEDLIRQGVEESPWDKLKVRVVLGTEEFAKKVTEKLKGTFREHSGKREIRQKVRFSDIVKVVERIKRERWADFRDRRGDYGKGLVLWAARRYTGMTLGQIGEAVGGIDYSAVSKVVARFEVKARKSRQLRQYQKKVQNELSNV